MGSPLKTNNLVSFSFLMENPLKIPDFPSKFSQMSSSKKFKVTFLHDKTIFFIPVCLCDSVYTSSCLEDHRQHSTTVPHSYLDEIGQSPDFYPPQEVLSGTLFILYYDTKFYCSTAVLLGKLIERRRERARKAHRAPAREG